MANEIKIDFDRSGTHGSVTELITKITEADSTGKADIPMPVVFTEDIPNEANLYQDKLVLAKDLLADITPERRVDFVSAAHFDGNGISPVGRTILAYAGLTESHIAGIASTLQTTPNAKEGNTLLATSLDALLEGVPSDVKRDFADNLKFMNGKVVSAKTDLLEKAVSPEKYEKILDIIMPVPAIKSGTDAVTRAKDEACVAYTGAKSRHVQRGCDWETGYTCNPATCVSSKNMN